MTPEIVNVSPDGPIATLGEAATQARSLRLKHPGCAIDIVMKGGIYRLARSVELVEEDSGTAEAPLRIRCAPEERVVLCGSRPLAPFEEISAPEVLNRLTARQQAHLKTISMADSQIPPIKHIEQRGQPPIELFCNGNRLPLSRFPEDGWLEIEDVPQKGRKLLCEGLEREKRYHDVPVGRHYGRFIYPGDRPKTWAFHQELLLHGYWTWDWSDSYQTVESIDTEKRSLALAPPHHNYGYTTKQRFAFLNVLEEIDSPGKWCFHRGSGRIYIWPLDIDSTGYSASVLREPLVRISDGAHTQIEGIEFCDSLGSGIRLDRCTNVEVTGCRFTRLGDTAVIAAGRKNVVRSCDLHDLSGGGIEIDGGDRGTLEAGDNLIDNNHIWDFSRWVRTYKHAIRIDGVGNTVSHNLIHNAPQEAMIFRGNEHIIEYNEIHSVTTETGDSGAIHTGRDWTWRGTILRFNFIHGLAGAGLHGAMGIYLDDFQSGTSIYGNVFYRAGRAAFIGGGRDNTVENNIFIECRASVHVDARGTSWASYYFDGAYPVLFEAMDAMKFRESPYSERYPVLPGLYDDDPAEPKNNRVNRNVSFGGQWLELRDKVRMEDFIHELNLVADERLCEQLRSGIAEDTYFLDINQVEQYERLEATDADAVLRFEVGGNIAAHGSSPVPRWRDRDFTVEPQVAELIGFQQIPFGKIGLYRDGFRTHLPKPKALSEDYPRN